MSTAGMRTQNVTINQFSMFFCTWDNNHTHGIVSHACAQLGQRDQTRLRVIIHCNGRSCNYWIESVDYSCAVPWHERKFKHLILGKNIILGKITNCWLTRNCIITFAHRRSQFRWPAPNHALYTITELLWESSSGGISTIVAGISQRDLPPTLAIGVPSVRKRIVKCRWIDNKRGSHWKTEPLWISHGNTMLFLQWSLMRETCFSATARIW
jgi:hypothetical protein